MQNSDNTLRTLVLAAVAAVGIAVVVSRLDPPRPASTATTATTVPPAATTPVPPAASGTAPKASTPIASGQWAASAPGRVEPKGGEVRIMAQVPGRITQVLVGVNDVVSAGDPLVRLDGSDIAAKLAAAEAEVSVRRRERDTETVNQLARDRRTADDNYYNAERALSVARAEVDRLLRQRPAPANLAADLTKAREAVTQAQSRVETTYAAVRKASIAEGAPAFTRLEAALTAARSDVEQAEIALERMTVRAPSSGTVLQTSATVGELAAPSPEGVLMVIGDVSALRVKAEIEERDIGKVKVGQVAVLKSDAFPDKEFLGKITARSQSLGPSRIGPRGPRKPTDVDVLEVTIDVDGTTTLLPGMRVDVFLKH